MASTQYQIYLTSVLNLCKTIVIKSAAVADAINADLTSMASGTRSRAYDVNLADPTTWKYYLNLSGQYHESDTMMTVISQDTLQTINFTVANLTVHTATAIAYQPGSRYYNDLLARYPAQEMLIRGILNPVTMAKAIASEDGDVLWYDTSLVESNEMSLISDLARWIKLFNRRWFNAAYVDTDDLYLAAHLSILYAMLPNVVLGLRLRNCHSYQAHSFHIREYLAGQGKLDEFVDYLTKPQQLWLYRNIRYILRNPGRQSTFQSLVQNILVPRGLPLSDWIMRHNTAHLQDTLTPEVEFVRGAITQTTADAGAQVRDVAQMLIAEANVAKGNQDVSQPVIDAITTEMALSKSDRLQTKVLESSVLDLTDASPYTLAHCLVNHWLYFASLGQYLSVIQVDNQTTGEIYTFNAADAFVIYVYCYNAANGIVLDEIPMFYAGKVRKLTTPTRAQIEAIVDTSVVEQEDLNAMFGHLPPLARNYLSIESFVTMVDAIHDDELFQHALFSTQGHLWKRVYLEQATLFFYQDALCDLGAGQNYVQWFKDRGLNIPQMSTEDLGTTANAILMEATGQNLATVTKLADLQAAMLRLMARLSSYAVQYLASINTTRIVVLERPAVRVGDLNAGASGAQQIELPFCELMDESGSGSALYTDLHPADVSTYDIEVGGVAKFTNYLNVRLQGGVAVSASDKIKLPVIGIMDFSDNLDFDMIDNPILVVSDYQPTGLKSLPEAFTTLAMSFYGPFSSGDLSTLQDRYTNYLRQNGLPVANLSQYIQVRNLAPFIDETYPSPQFSEFVPVTDLRPFIQPMTPESLSSSIAVTDIDGLHGPMSLTQMVTQPMINGLTLFQLNGP